MFLSPRPWGPLAEELCNKGAQALLYLCAFLRLAFAPPLLLNAWTGGGRGERCVYMKYVYKYMVFKFFFSEVRLWGVVCSSWRLQCSTPLCEFCWCLLPFCCVLAFVFIVVPFFKRICSLSAAMLVHRVYLFVSDQGNAVVPL